MFLHRKRETGDMVGMGKAALCVRVCFQMGTITCFYADENLAAESTNTAEKRGEACRHLSLARDRRWGIVARWGSVGGRANSCRGEGSLDVFTSLSMVLIDIEVDLLQWARQIEKAWLRL